MTDRLKETWPLDREVVAVGPAEVTSNVPLYGTVSVMLPDEHSIVPETVPEMTSDETSPV